MGRRGTEILLVALLFIVTFAVFSPALSADFVEWDDNLGIYQNPNLPFSLDRLGWVFRDASVLPRFVPFSMLKWVVIYQFCEIDPFGYHLSQVLIHCANVALLFLVIWRLLERVPGNQPRAASVWLPVSAAVGALLWALHPLRVEAVAWISCTYGQGLMFMLLSLLCYLRGAAQPNGICGPALVSGGRVAVCRGAAVAPDCSGAALGFARS